jgi:TolB-like protein/Tfp pilus assembly protein PilF
VERAGTLKQDYSRVKEVEDSATPVSRESGARLWILCVAAVVAMIAGAAISSRDFLPPRSPQINAIAVLPLRNLSGDPDRDYLAAGLTEMLTTEIAHMGAFDVIAPTSTLGYQSHGKTARQIARELNVDALVEGSVQHSGNRVLITAQLIDPRTDRPVWARSYERELADVLALQRDLANDVAAEIRANIPSSKLGRPAHISSSNPEAEDAYLRARDVFRRGDNIKRSFELFQQAIQKDPNFAAAYAALPFGLMMAGGLLPSDEGLTQWRVAASRALDLDPNLADAHLSHGTLLGYHDWNWLEAEKEYKTALKLNPSFARAYKSYGTLLVFMGRMDEGLQKIEQGERLDPFGNRTDPGKGGALFLARRPDELMEQARKMEDVDARLPRLFRGYAYQLKGEFDNAIRELKGLPDEGVVRTERQITALAHAYASAGRMTEAQQLLDQLTQISKRRKVQAWWFASIHAALGNKDQAFEWLDKAYQERPSEMIFFRVSPEMDPLRSDPRYHAMLKRMNFPQ